MEPALRKWNRLAAEMLRAKMKNWRDTTSTRPGSAPPNQRRLILKRACDAITKADQRVVHCEDLIQLDRVGPFMAEKASEVIASEPFQCFTEQREEIGKLGFVLLKVLCESVVRLNRKSALRHAQDMMKEMGEIEDGEVRLCS